jgi:hypothetical protein
VLGVLEFVDEGDRVVLEGNTAVALCVGDQVVVAQAEFTCALAGLKESDWAEVGPIDCFRFLTPGCERPLWGSIPWERVRTRAP